MTILAPVVRYFRFLAQQSFTRDADGGTLFLPEGPITRPYRVPDDETKQRLESRLAGLFAAELIPGCFLVGMVSETLFSRSAYFFVYLIGVAIFHWTAMRLLFFRELKQMSRAKRRSRVNLTQDLANRCSTRTLRLGFAGCIGFVLIGTVMLITGVQPISIAITNIVLFGLCAAMWGGALRVQRGTSG